MEKKKKICFIAIWLLLIAALLVGIFLCPTPEKEDIKVAMKDAVLHETNKIPFFGAEVNPAVISAFTVTGILLVFSLIMRIFVIPKFKQIPGKFQSLSEAAVGFFDNLAKTNSPHKNTLLGVYLFGAGVYIFIGTIFELFGLQWINTEGASVTLPAPLADINAAIMLGSVSFLFILFGGLFTNGFSGMGKALKDFSLPISMSFRLFGALLSGALVTDLVYHYLTLSFVLPVFVAILFTIIHAIIQTYVLTTLTSVFYGEVTEKKEKKEKKHKKQKEKTL